ncbi:DnaD domain protein [Sutcliffiella horikoshii]|uniref:DnaD domain-containing protein n=1 Tax=Sutcliffiella horikoshii TaxID=79883 RepID=UPI001CBB3848|nr:DnaD domain protein [Sutcliffiella horikoshii]UAL46829.1 DnaD domain protein [Sutcliffiella horikoshii]
MSYPEEITAFYDQLETNPLSSSAIALWYALVYNKMKVGKLEKFSVARSILMERSGLKLGAFKKARNELMSKNYIQMEPRTGGQSSVYHLPLWSKYDQEKPLGSNSDQGSSQGSDQEKPLGSNSDQGSSQDSSQGSDPLYRQIDRKIDRQDEPKSKSTWSEILEEWKTVFGFDIKPNHAERLGTYIDHDGMAESLILEGIERVRQSDKKVMNYLWTTLSNWAKANVKTIADLQMYERQRSDGEGGAPFSKKQSNLDFLAEYKRKRGIGT